MVVVVLLSSGRCSSGGGRGTIFMVKVWVLEVIVIFDGGSK